MSCFSFGLVKNHTHVKKVGHTSEFPFGIYLRTLKNPKKQNFEKMKKNCWRYHHLTHVQGIIQKYFFFLGGRGLAVVRRSAIMTIIKHS